MENQQEKRSLHRKYSLIKDHFPMEALIELTEITMLGEDNNTKCVFLHLLFMACYEPCFYRDNYLEVGQIATTLKEISEGTGISVQSIRTSLNRLKSTNEITINSTNKFSIITLLNYSDYQGDNKPSNNQLTNNQQTTNKQLTNDSYNKEIKEVKKNKEYISYEKKRGKKKVEINPSFDLEEIEEKLKSTVTVI